MDVYKRKDGRSPFWQYDITLPDGSRQRCSTKEKDKAKARKAMLLALGEAQAEADAPKASLTLLAALDAYLGSLEADGKVWYRTAKIIRDKMFGLGGFEGRYALPKGMRLDEITQETITSLRAARRREGAAQGTVGHELRVMRAAVFMAGVRPVVKWAVPQPVSKTRWLTTEEWQSIYAEMDPKKPMGRRGTDETFPPSPHIEAERLQARDLLVAVTLCGGRWGEVTRLTTDTILPGGRIRLFGRKTGKERIVPLPAPAAEAMERRRRIAEATGTPYLFPANRTARASLRDEAPKEFQTSSNALKRAFERSGVNVGHKVERDGKATLHSLRHTFASWCLHGGLSLQEVQELLGHGSITMTTRYAHLEAGRAVSKASEIMGGHFVSPL